MATGAKNRSAAASSDGAIAQFDLGLYTLAEGQFDRVGIETSDDVGGESESGAQLRAQSKQALEEGGNAVTWRSVALWKTLQIWIEAIEAGSCDVGTTGFVLVARTLTKDKELLKLSCPAKNVADALAARFLKEAGSPSDTIKPFAASVINFGQDRLAVLLQRVRLVERSLDADAKALKAVLRIPDGVDATAVVRDLRGWLIDECRQCWHKGEPAWVSKSTFDTARFELLKRHDRRRKMVRQFRRLGKGLEAAAMSREVLFVKQLMAIRATEEEVAEAITNHFQYGEERIRLTRAGEVFADDWDAHDNELAQQWRPRHRSCCDEKSLGKEEAGLKLYREVCGLAPINVADVETHREFCNGAYQSLASRRVVGWHPEFKTII